MGPGISKGNKNSRRLQGHCYSAEAGLVISERDVSLKLDQKHT